jgi:hypothetical protein
MRMDLLVEGIRPLPGRHVTDHQMRLYMQFRETKTPPVAAAKASISAATAYRFEHDHRPPSARQKVRGRRRPDPLAAFFDSDVVPMLEAAPDLRCVAIFEEMQRRHPELASGVRRTMERRIRA